MVKKNSLNDVMSRYFVGDIIVIVPTRKTQCVVFLDVLELVYFLFGVIL